MNSISISPVSRLAMTDTKNGASVRAGRQVPAGDFASSVEQIQERTQSTKLDAKPKSVTNDPPLPHDHPRNRTASSNDCRPIANPSTPSNATDAYAPLLSAAAPVPPSPAPNPELPFDQGTKDQSVVGDVAGVDQTASSQNAKVGAPQSPQNGPNDGQTHLQTGLNPDFALPGSLKNSTRPNQISSSSIVYPDDTNTKSTPEAQFPGIETGAKLDLKNGDPSDPVIAKSSSVADSNANPDQSLKLPTTGQRESSGKGAKPIAPKAFYGQLAEVRNSTETVASAPDSGPSNATIPSDQADQGLSTLPTASLSASPLEVSGRPAPTVDALPEAMPIPSELLPTGAAYGLQSSSDGSDRFNEGRDDDPATDSGARPASGRDRRMLAVDGAVQPFVVGPSHPSPSNADVSGTSNISASTPAATVGDAAPRSQAQIELHPSTSDTFHSMDTSDAKFVPGPLDSIERGEIHVSLQNEALGTVELRARVHGENVAASITVEKHDTQLMLSNALPNLHQALSDRSLRLEHITVKQGLSDMSAQTSHSNQDGRSSPSRSESSTVRVTSGGGSAGGSAFFGAGFSGETGVFDTDGRLNVRA